MMHKRLFPVCGEDAVGDIQAHTYTEYYCYVSVNGSLHPQEHNMTADMFRGTIKGTAVKACKQM